MAYDSKKLADMTQAEKDELLEEIRARYTYAVSEWQHIREDARKDMLCLAGEVWEALDPVGLKQRQDAKRPALTLDEASQYIDQTVNGVRANPRSVKFSPTGEGTNDKTAGFYADKTREIEYRSKATSIVYPTAFECGVSRGYGFCRVNTKYRRGSRSEQELWLEAFPNPDLVLPDPNALMPDSSDMRYCFVLEGKTTVDEFKREYPNARVVDFSGDHASSQPDWYKGQFIQLAEYWRVDGTPEDDNITVCQYITNGFEILKKNAWAGRYIPIVSCYGKVLYVPQSGTTKRHLVSMMRLARDPLMLYCYYRTQQAEMAGMIPKTPVTAYEGQMEGWESEWQRAAHEPVPYLYFKGKTDATGENLLPPPQRLDYHAGEHLQSLELCAEGARRAIQSAMAGSPLPTAAQRKNEKSGKALQRIEESSQRGSFHYVDHYNAMIEHVGVVLEDLMDKIYDTARNVGVRKANDTAEVVRINDPEHPSPLDIKGDYLVTVSSEPSFDSRRDETNDFLDALVSTPEMLAIAGPEKAPKVMAQAIKARNLGPSGDALAELFDPSLSQDQGEPNPQQLQAQNAELKAKLEQVGQAAQQMQQQLETDAAKQQAMLEKARIDAKTTFAVAQMAEHTKLAVAKLQSIVKPSNEQAAEAEQAELDRHNDAAMEEMKHAHAMELERLKAEFAADAAMRAEASAFASGERGHEHDVENAERGHQHALESGDQQIAGTIAAEKAKPKPEASAE